MATGSNRARWSFPNGDSILDSTILVCFVAMLSYAASALGAALLLRPQMLSPLWPGCVLLVSVLLLVSRKMWPILIVTAFAVFFFHDLHAGVSTSESSWLILADTVEVLAAALCLSYFFVGVPRLNSVKALTKFSLFAVILAPALGAIGRIGGRASCPRLWVSSP
jgi:integral membrane sensor domain MASE1